MYNSSGSLGYGIRTQVGGGWAWQLIDASNNAYFHVQYPNGNVGIGTTNPSAKLNVYNSNDKTEVIIGNPSTGTGGFTSLIMGTSADTNGYGYIEGVKSSGSAFGDVIINRFGAKVGIGTTSPSATLDVNGDVQIRTIAQNNYSKKIVTIDENTGKLSYRDLGFGFSTYLGFEAGNSNVGYYCNGIGHRALYLNTGNFNNGFGYFAMTNNTTGEHNNAFGHTALVNNVTGSFNTAVGSYALERNISGNYNVAIGHGALSSNQGGIYNTAIGHFTSSSISSFNNTTVIGALAVPTASNQVRLGNSIVTSIGGQVSWSTLSDGRFKLDVKEDVSGLDFINLLRPVSYIVDKDKLEAFLGIPDSLRQKKSSARSELVRQTGFVAQEVEQAVRKSGYVFSGVEAPQNEHDHYSIRYADFVVPLAKAVQELSVQLEKQQRTIDDLKKIVDGNRTKDIEGFLEVELFQNHPNPFRENTEIKMIVPKNIQSAVLFIYDLSGKQIDKRIINERGETSSRVEGGSLSPGIYLYTLVADGRASTTKRMILTD
ncbi:MAG: T9SS type A sorting domain-containing protein [Cyclobacteriaceae bacterium]|nr:T9SS type A sorting domain-containing protein [Cyclobacteriaceae bacterium]